MHFSWANVSVKATRTHAQNFIAVHKMFLLLLTWKQVKHATGNLRLDWSQIVVWFSSSLQHVLCKWSLDWCYQLVRCPTHRAAVSDYWSCHAACWTEERNGERQSVIGQVCFCQTKMLSSLGEKMKSHKLLQCLPALPAPKYSYQFETACSHLWIRTHTILKYQFMYRRRCIMLWCWNHLHDEENVCNGCKLCLHLTSLTLRILYRYALTLFQSPEHIYIYCYILGSALWLSKWNYLYNSVILHLFHGKAQTLCL